jgi:uncharacterized phage protein (TIGR01671 family)
MKREIKFRAWDGKEMFQDIIPIGEGQFISGFMMGINICLPMGVQTSVLIHHTKAVGIMQYTGLKDKNGKEIYEGDIIDAEYSGSSAGKYRNQVQYFDESCSFEFANSPMWTWENIEIIGNIHENPELL